MAHAHANGRDACNGPGPPSEVLDREPPSAIDMECRLLGCCLLDSSIVAQCDLRPGDFRDDRNRLIYLTLRELADEGLAGDVDVLTHRLKDRGKFDDAGGTTHLAELLNSVAIPGHWRTYAQPIREKAALRRIIWTATETLHDAYLSRRSAGSILEKMRNAADEEGERSARRRRFKGIACADLMTMEFDVRFLVERILADRQPCMVAGPSKTLKTSLLLDLALSLSQAGHFLGKFKVPEAVTVGVMTGESGLPTVTETIRRISHAANIDPATVRNLVVTEEVPRFGDLLDEDDFRAFVREHAIEVAMVDPAYMVLDGDNQSNLAAQGEQLRRMNEVCQEQGVSLILCHHTKKETSRRYEPLELADLSGAGVAEWCRQWLLLSRRERYEPGTGSHRLWLSAGGSVGHGGLWGLDIEEGRYDDAGGRIWQVDVLSPDDVGQGIRDRADDAREAKHQERIEQDQRKLCQVMLRYPQGETAKAIREAAGLNPSRFTPALAGLIERGHVTACEILKPNRKTPYDGYKLAE